MNINRIRKIFHHNKRNYSFSFNVWFSKIEQHAFFAVQGRRFPLISFLDEIVDHSNHHILRSSDLLCKSI